MSNSPTPALEKVTLEKPDELHGIITVTVPREAYAPKFADELQKFKKGAQLKGFRKGHTPMSLVRRMYGQAILADVIQHEIDHQLRDYLVATSPNFFGQPLPKVDQEPLDIRMEYDGDYSVQFEMGLVPEFDLAGMDAQARLTVPDVQITEAMVDSQVEALRRRHGDRQEVTEGTAGDMDQVELHLEEWADGRKKEGGVHTHTHFLINDRMSDALRLALTGKAIGETFHFDPFEAEKDASPDHVRKYILHLEEDAPDPGHDFLARLDKIIRITPAALDADFFTAAFGPDRIQDESSMREHLRDEIRASYQGQVREYLQDQMRVNLLQANRIALPEGFLRRWVDYQEREKDEPAEWTEHQFRLFFDDLRWSLIRDKIIRDRHLSVSDDELVADYREKLLQYFGQIQDNGLLDQMARRVLTDEETRQKIGDQLIAAKVADAYASTVTNTEESIPADGFRPWMENAYAAINAYFSSGE